MKILLATQGSQGVVALRELFALGYSPDNIIVAICKSGVNDSLVSFLDFNKMKYDLIGSGVEFDELLVNITVEPSVLLSISWKYKFSNAVIKKFRNNAINLHPGLLPEYKGCFSTPWAIINNEDYTGFTYHVITSDFDGGPILIREEIKIENEDTSHSLNYRVMQKALAKLGEVLVNKYKRCPQPKGGRYYPNKLPFDGVIDSAWDEQMRNRFIRAMYFPPYNPAVEVKGSLVIKHIPQGRK